MKTIVSTNFFHPEMYAVMESGVAVGTTTIANAPAKLYLEGVTDGQLVLGLGASTIQYGVVANATGGLSEFNYKNSFTAGDTNHSFWSCGTIRNNNVVPGPITVKANSLIPNIKGFEAHSAFAQTGGLGFSSSAFSFYAGTILYSISWDSGANGLILARVSTDVTPTVLNGKPSSTGAWKTCRVCVWLDTTNPSAVILNIKVIGVQGAGASPIFYYSENIGAVSTVGTVSDAVGNAGDWGCIFGSNFNWGNGSGPVSNLSYYLLDQADIDAREAAAVALGTTTYGTIADLLPFARVMTVPKSQLDIVQDASDWTDLDGETGDAFLEASLTDGNSLTMVKNESGVGRLRLQSTESIKNMANGSDGANPHWYYLSEGSKKIYAASAVNVRAVIPVMHKVADDNGEDIDIHALDSSSSDVTVSTSFAPGVDVTKGHLFENTLLSLTGDSTVETSINKQNA